MNDSTDQIPAPRPSPSAFGHHSRGEAFRGSPRIAPARGLSLILAVLAAGVMLAVFTGLVLVVVVAVAVLGMAIAAWSWLRGLFSSEGGNGGVDSQGRQNVRVVRRD